MLFIIKVQSGLDRREGTVRILLHLVTRLDLINTLSLEKATVRKSPINMTKGHPQSHTGISLPK